MESVIRDGSKGPEGHAPQTIVLWFIPKLLSEANPELDFGGVGV